MKHSSSEEFQQTVDTEQFPHIINPMDLPTIRKNITNGVYTNPDDFILDIELMLNNAKTYYKKKSVIRQKSVEFEEIIKPYIIHLSEN